MAPTTKSSANGLTHETNHTTLTNENPAIIETPVGTNTLAVTTEFGRANFLDGFLFRKATSAY